MLAGEWYVTDAEILALQAQRPAVIEAYNTSSSSDPIRRRTLLHESFGALGDHVEVRSPVYVDYGSNVSLGSGTFLNFGCQLADVAQISLGEAVLLGPWRGHRAVGSEDRCRHRRGGGRSRHQGPTGRRPRRRQPRQGGARAGLTRIDAGTGMGACSDTVRLGKGGTSRRKRPHRGQRDGP